jgi:hypothetical protein
MCFNKNLATVVLSADLVALAITNFEKWSTANSIYKFPEEVLEIGPIKSIPTVSKTVETGILCNNPAGLTVGIFLS